MAAFGDIVDHFFVERETIECSVCNFGDDSKEKKVFVYFFFRKISKGRIFFFKVTNHERLRSISINFSFVSACVHKAFCYTLYFICF